MASKQVVELNVGGKLLATCLSTLKKEEGSKLCEMLEEESQITRDKDGRVFIDYDGDAFVHVLNYLRTGSFPPKEMVTEVYECAENFGIKSLVEALKFHQAVFVKNMKVQMMKTFDREQYEDLKRCFISEIGTKFHPEEDKYVVFETLPSKCHMTVQENDKTYHHYGVTTTLMTPAKCPINSSQQLLFVTTLINDDIMKCLGHDLCELGYGNCTYYICNMARLFTCVYCGPITANILFLSKTFLGKNYDWKM